MDAPFDDRPWGTRYAITTIDSMNTITTINATNAINTINTIMLLILTRKKLLPGIHSSNRFRLVANRKLCRFELVPSCTPTALFMYTIHAYKQNAGAAIPKLGKMQMVAPVLRCQELHFINRTPSRSRHKEPRRPYYTPIHSTFSAPRLLS